MYQFKFPPMRKASENRYQALLEKVFTDRYKKGAEEVPFSRGDLEAAANLLKIALPKNLGDVIYSVRYRKDLPAAIVKVGTKGREWVIEGDGRAKYVFRLQTVNKIAPNPNLLAVKIPDATPEIISAHALSDEQALLAKVRYNRLIDIFLGLTCYPLQNHLRTTVRGIGQIEIDEIYIGINKKGAQFVIPVQAKGGTDRLGMVQTRQDIECCAQKFPNLVCRAISTQFITDNLIALFELTIDGGELKVVEERHYQLVSASEISGEDLKRYASV
jgi:hypothetical protein